MSDRVDSARDHATAMRTTGARIVALQRILSACVRITLCLLLGQNAYAAQRARGPRPILSAQYERLTTLRTLSKRSLSATLRLPVVTATPRYSIVNLEAVLGLAPSEDLPIPVAIDQRGRILLAGADDYVASTPSDIVFENGKHFALASGCPACDPTAPSAVVALAFNDAGNAVGYWHDYAGPEPDGTYSGVYWNVSETGSSIADIIAGANGFAYLDAVNDRAVSVGLDGTTDGGGNPTTAGRFDRSGFLGFLGLAGSANACNGMYGTISAANAINDAGTIVGNALRQTDCLTSLAVRFPNTGAPLPLPVTAPSTANAINAAGHIVGAAAIQRNFYGPNGPGIVAYLDRPADARSRWPFERPLYLPFPPGYSRGKDSETPYSVDDEDDVVGDLTVYSAGGAPDYSVGFLYAHGRTYDLNTLLPAKSGWQILDAAAINDRGEIIGEALYKNAEVPYLLIPAKSSGV